MVMERWAYRLALNINRDEDTGKWPRNEEVYKRIGEKNIKFDEFVEKGKKKWNAKCEGHRNKLVRKLVKR